MLDYEYLLLDADGTFLDFSRTEEESLRSLFSHFGIPYTPQLVSSYHKSNALCWKMLEEGSLGMKELEERRFRLFFDSQDLALDSHEASEYYIDRLSQEAYLIDGARNLLERLYGDYRLVVITNGIARVQRGRLARLGLTGLFSHIVISGEIGASKPSAEFFDRTLEITGAGRKDCLVIGDSLTSDMKGALDNGFDALYLHLGKQDVQVPEGVKYDAESYAQLADIIYAD